MSTAKEMFAPKPTSTGGTDKDGCLEAPPTTAGKAKEAWGRNLTQHLSGDCGVWEARYLSPPWLPICLLWPIFGGV